VAPLLLIAVCAGMVVAPFLFESYTFYLYTISEPDFFTFSGARLWFFLAVEVSLGYALGRFSRIPPYMAAACIAVAVLVLMSLLYQICDERQCYYSGPDDMSWLRFGTLLFATAAAGLMMGTRSKKEPAKKSSIDAVLFGAAMVIFLGYYPAALFFGTFMPYQTALAILAFASSAPFLLGGIASTIFSDRARHAIYSAAIGWAILVAVFAGLRPEGVPLAAAIIAVGIPAALLGRKIAKHIQSKLAVMAIALFALISVHPFLDAPMNLALNESSAAIAQPTYYAGAYHDEEYFPTKRVEVELDLGRFDGGMIRDRDFVLAGIGAQSPNCCKDGLDYGYRADVLFMEDGRYLVARAWETCDQNMGCSAFPWISTMHQAKVPLPGNHSSVMLAMQWDSDDVTVDWYYKTDGNWSKYSSFVSPEIENPYFNLGVIMLGSPNTWQDIAAYFYQAGVSTPRPELEYGEIAFDCPAYYDRQGEKHCPPLTPVENGRSHWKVLWKWGLQDDNAKVVVNGTRVAIS
jgi:hypothetical protein